MSAHPPRSWPTPGAHAILLLDAAPAVPGGPDAADAAHPRPDPAVPVRAVLLPASFPGRGRPGPPAEPTLVPPSRATDASPGLASPPAETPPVVRRSPDPARAGAVGPAAAVPCDWDLPMPAPTSEASPRETVEVRALPVLPALEAPRPRRLEPTPLSPSWYAPYKATLDSLCAAALLLLASPVILFCALLVKLTSRGPAFYSQIRLGRRGRPFRIYKLRTMTHDCEKVGGARWSTPGDPRVTPVGRFLRRTHLDELPQLWNVLKGDMSLVGPRPERPEFLPGLERVIPRYRERLSVKPGVTGLAQVRLPADTDIASVRRKLAYDLHYLRTFGLWLDLRLVLCTGLHMLGVPYAVLGRLFRLPRPVVP
jgi:lipopolysaccharide/colanic/teichoic acid biosynthesis glycosyltransferase